MLGFREHARQRRHRDCRPSTRLGRGRPRRAPEPARRAGRRFVAAPEHRRGAPPLRSSIAGAGTLDVPARRAPRHRSACRQQGAAAHRGGRARRAQVPRMPMGSTSTGSSTTTCRSASGSTSVSVPRSPGSKAGSRSKRPCGCIPTGTSTASARCACTPRRCGAGRQFRCTEPGGDLGRQSSTSLGHRLPRTLSTCCSIVARPIPSPCASRIRATTEDVPCHRSSHHCGEPYRLARVERRSLAETTSSRTPNCGTDADVSPARSGRVACDRAIESPSSVRTATDISSCIWPFPVPDWCSCP